MKRTLTFFFICLLFNQCTNHEETRKVQPPPSSSSKMPWNRPLPGEGSSQFGGMLERR